MRLLTTLVLAARLVVAIANDAATCSDVKEFYRDNACCGAGSRTVCVPNATAQVEELVATIFKVAVGPTSTDCILHEMARTPFSQERRAECTNVPLAFRTTLSPRVLLDPKRSENEYTSFVATHSPDRRVRFRLLASTPLQTDTTTVAYTHAATANNFWHTLTLNATHFLVAVRGKAYRKTEAASGLYAFERDTLRRTAWTGIHAALDATLVTRYAPVITEEGHVWAAHWGWMDSSSVAWTVFDKHDWTSFETLSLKGRFDFVQRGYSVNGPIANLKVDNDAQCGQRVYISSGGIFYVASMQFSQRTRAAGFPTSPQSASQNKGQVDCWCSKTKAPCPEAAWPYYNGASSGLDRNLAFSTVYDWMLNTNRSDSTGALMQATCDEIQNGWRRDGTTEPGWRIDDLVPYFYVVSLTTVNSTVLPTGTVLSTLASRVKLQVLGVTGCDESAATQDDCYKVAYYGGHYDTPSLGMELNATNHGTVTLASLHYVATSHAAVTLVTDSGREHQLTHVVHESLAPATNFDGTINLDALYDECQATEAWAAYNHTKGEGVDGYPITNFAGLTIGVKFRLNDAIPASARESMRTFGGNNWVPGSHDGNRTLFIPFGNAHILSFDAYHVTQPILMLQRALQTARDQAAAANDTTAFRAALGRHPEIVALRKQQRALLSAYDASFKENSIHAIDAKTGVHKWSTMLEGVDQWHVEFTNLISWFPQKIDAATANALATDIHKDSDANNVVPYGANLIASTKGGTLASLSQADGSINWIKKVAPGTHVGGAAPGNFGGLCVTTSGFAVLFSAMVGAIPESPTWITKAGTVVTAEQTLLTFVAVSDGTVVHEEVVHLTGGAGAVSCIENTVVATCAATTTAAPRACTYVATREGVTVQDSHAASLLPNQAILDPESGAPVRPHIDVSQSMICDGIDCYSYNGGNSVEKYRMS